MVLQLRNVVGTNTMGPPSCHPNGERIAWALRPESEVPELDAATVWREAALAALLAVVQRCYPGEGKRNQLQLHLSGALCHNGYSAAEADEANGWLAKRNADEQAKSRQQAKKTEAKQKAGKKTTGLPKLVELLGLPKECIATFKQWLSPQDAEEKTQGALEELNARYFVAEWEGKTVVAQYEFDDEAGRNRLVFSRDKDIKLKYQNRYVEMGDKTVRLGDAWLGWPGRRTFSRIVLIPKGPVPEGAFNLWRGFGVEPMPGEWPTIHKHLLSVICSGNGGHYAWLVNLLAYWLQHPESLGWVALVLRGAKGTGKGALVHLLRRIFRHHHLQIFQARHLTGNFNGHLKDVLFLHVDEAFWAGDKQGEAVLKGLVTEETLPIERKGLDVSMARNRLKLLLNANDDWAFPASWDERRAFMPTVSDAMRGKKAYFDALFAAINGEEAGHFLEAMLKRDLSNFDVHNPPNTEELGRQKLLSASGLAKWWLDVLTSGDVLYGANMPDVDLEDRPDEEWPGSVAKRLLHSVYLRHAQKHGDRRPLIGAHFSRKLAELMPRKRLRETRPHRAVGPRPEHFLLPPLEECRTAFLASQNIVGHKWPVLTDEPAPTPRPAKPAKPGERPRLAPTVVAFAKKPAY
jgi:hypothetical protein